MRFFVLPHPQTPRVPNEGSLSRLAKIANQRGMIAALRPVRVRANGHIDAEWMKLLGGEYIVDVITLR